MRDVQKAVRGVPKVIWDARGVVVGGCSFIWTENGQRMGKAGQGMANHGQRMVRGEKRRKKKAVSRRRCKENGVNFVWIGKHKPDRMR